MAIDNIPQHATGHFIMLDDSVAEILWVTAYEIFRQYGGPEEGGWYYDVGHVLASIPCLTDEQVNNAIAVLETLYADEYQDRKERYSVIGEEDLSIVIDTEKGKDFPEETPHYE